MKVLLQKSQGINLNLQRSEICQLNFCYIQHSHRCVSHPIFCSTSLQLIFHLLQKRAPWQYTRRSAAVLAIFHTMLHMMPSRMTMQKGNLPALRHWHVLKTTYYHNIQLIWTGVSANMYHTHYSCLSCARDEMCMYEMKTGREELDFSFFVIFLQEPCSFYKRKKSSFLETCHKK